VASTLESEGPTTSSESNPTTVLLDASLNSIVEGSSTAGDIVPSLTVVVAVDVASVPSVA
jgi:hypothetical protein